MKIPSNTKLLTCFIGILILSALYTVTVLLIHRDIKIHFKNGDSLTVKPASLYESINAISGSSPYGRCKLNIQTSSGQTAQVDLYQDVYNLPIIVLPAGSNSFFCIYCYDVDIQLLRIDLSQPFQPSKSKRFISANVLKSSCNIERIETTDAANWAAAQAALERISAREYKSEVIGLNLLFFPVPMSQRTLIDIIKNHGNQGVYGEGF
jgi:hypothetical protein